MDNIVIFFVCIATAFTYNSMIKDGFAYDIEKKYGKEVPSNGDFRKDINATIVFKNGKYMEIIYNP